MMRVSKDEVTAFCEAIWRHDAKTLAALGRRVDPNALDRWRRSPLLVAAEVGDLALVKLLVERGGEVDQGRRHLTPVTLAARRGDLATVRFLRDRGATMSLVSWIYLCDRRQVARALAGDPALARLRDELGTPVLHHAVEALAAELVELLLERGAGVAEADANGETALHRVADMRPRAPAAAARMAALLIDRGADPNARNWDDVTPLHQGVRRRNLAVVEVLLARGADVNARDRGRGSTPLRRAVSGTGASGTAGTSALMLPLARLLLEHGADPEAKDKRGATVLASARDPDLRALLARYRRGRRARASASGPASRSPRRRLRERRR
jgi:ankyrin repeat protein